jgi:hypothetical protein
MDHDEAREILDLAAAEPGGFERLAAGDTPESAALATHLAGCPDCAAEFGRLGRLSATLRTAVREMPPPELRERTLTLVQSAGRPRRAGSAAQGTPPEPDAGPARHRRRWDRAPWLALAAAIVVAVVATGGWWRTSADLGTAEAAATSLEHATVVAVEVAAAPDARTVALAPPGQASDPAPSGQLIYSMDDTELVVLTEGLAPPETGWTYHCWVEDSAGQRDLGPMTVGDDVVYWVGWSTSMDGAAPNASFGVSLVPAGSTSGRPVLEGP